MAVLVKFDKNWADEFDVTGFAIYNTREEWEEALGDIEQLEYYFGTNEFWDAGEFEDLDFSVIEITDSEAATLVKLFGYTWGSFPL